MTAVTPKRLGLIVYLLPIIAVLEGTVLLDETFTPIVSLGGASLLPALQLANDARLFQPFRRTGADMVDKRRVPVSGVT